MDWGKLIGSILKWWFTYLLLDLMWVSAEVVFEGAAHSSLVDGMVNAWLTSLVVGKMEGRPF